MWSLSLRQAFPSGGRWTKRSFGRMRGSRTTFRHFSQKAALQQPAFLASPSGKLSASADWRGLCKPSPCLKKIQQTSFFRQKLSAPSCFPLSSTLSPFQSIPALTLSSLLYPGFRRSGSSRPLQSPFFILPALFKNHFSSQSFRSASLFSPEAQLLSHNFPQNAFYRATFFYFKCEHLFVFL